MSNYMYCLVARGHTILVETDLSGSNSQAAQSILKKIPLSEPVLVKKGFPHKSYPEYDLLLCFFIDLALSLIFFISLIIFLSSLFI